jgi:methyl-accepting chemotaxis protein
MNQSTYSRKIRWGRSIAVIGICAGCAAELVYPGRFFFLVSVAAAGALVAASIFQARDIDRLTLLLEKNRNIDASDIRKMGAALQPLAAKVAEVIFSTTEELENTHKTLKRLSAEQGASSAALRGLEQSLDEQRNFIARADGEIRTISDSLKHITAHLGVLDTSAEQSTSSILEMTMTTEEVAKNMSVMSASVRDTVSSIDQMAQSIKESADSIDTLSAAAEETSSSMTEIDRSIDQVQSNANETAKMAAEVAVDAEKGAEAVAKTLRTINRIKDSSQEAVNVISSLNEKIGAIGHILNVIDDVSEQTNLLALNAAIIAAQAGEHGKGFAVVADEIKELSERSGVSTKEIADLIKSVQTESLNAISAVEQGNTRVDEGVRVSAEAERALMQILSISKKAVEMMNAIARATVEQSYGSKQVTDAVSRIAEHVQQIAAAAAEQARGAELIISGSETMRSITQHVERSTAEQTEGGRQITQSVESISKKVKQLETAYREQQSGIEALVMLSEKIHSISKSQKQLLSEAEGPLTDAQKTTKPSGAA